MNYYEARQINEGPLKGKWHFTSANRRSGTHPVGYCSRWRDEGDKAVEISEEEFNAHAHDTREEAEECYRQYELHHARFADPPENPQQLHRCEAKDCSEYTAGLAEVGQTRLLFLCDAHRNRETLETLVEPSQRIMSSY